MVKLIKYEIRRQMFFKAVILSVLAGLELLLMVALLIGNKEFSNVMNRLFSICAALTLFYLVIEPVLEYKNDLTKKQGYLLFMTPNSTLRIVGSKIIAGSVQIIALFVLFVGISIFDDYLYSVKYVVDVHSINTVRNALNAADFSYAQFCFKVAALLFEWFYYITVAFFSISISYTLHFKGRLGTVVSFLLVPFIFIIETMLISFMLIPSIYGRESEGVSLLITSFLVCAIPAIVNYFLTVQLLNWKLDI